MRQQWRVAVNVLAFVMVTYVFCILQTSFRPLSGVTWLRWLPPPTNWLPPLVYLGLYRKPLEGVITSYFVVLSFSQFTVTSLGLLWLIGLAVFCFCQLVKSRVFFNGGLYFLLLCCFSSVVYNVTHVLASWAAESHPMGVPHIGRWLGEFLVMPVSAIPYFLILSLVDNLTQKAPLTEMSRERL